MLFPYNDENYLIFSNNHNTFLGLLTRDGLRIIDTLLQLPTGGFNNSLYNQVNEYYHYSFQRSSQYSDGQNFRKTVSSGDIYVKENSIVIAYSYDEKIEK